MKTPDAINYQDGATISKIDEWRAKQAVPPSRTHVIRTAILEWLKNQEKD